ncbi:enoyl-CoA hydratase/isomerase family protein [Microbacterium sp. RU33B]|uniref:enoyl-CoA hydratase/isomerase family protein n=1 Tax=Microbacterium sp. RU33B TaxID=1907390 RepID=UPI00095EBC82|nr:enoyl-CoA hydratase/isomerase family protein [Microbacterium sp. RU33B]SIT86817.1 Enoyl-CoA hydratase/carnithine racemase [Microbacterium sp. RU33B]
MSAVELERDGAILWARLRRPEAGNACSSEVMELLEQWTERAHDPGVRALILTGSGATFCAGADLTEATRLLADPPALLAFLERGRALVQRIRRASVPTIAAVNGAAFAGGLELLLACDIAVAARSARIGDRHIRVGQVPGWGSSAMLPAAVGPSLARRLLLTGETWSADDALRHGLVSEVVDDEALAECARGVAESIARHDPAAVQRMLTLARGSSDGGDVAWAREWETLVAHVATQGPEGSDEMLSALRRRDQAD